MTATIAPAGDAARDRICAGAIRALVALGHAASMAEIAAASGVSKALLHYHYNDRARLLAEVTDRIARRLVARERAAVDTATAGTALDALWGWTEAELARGELRALLELAVLRDAPVRAASARAATLRRASAAATATHVFAQLGLGPRVPAELLGDASTAFLDGLALDAASGRDARVSFDVLWLALLGLAE